MRKYHYVLNDIPKSDLFHLAEKDPPAKACWAWQIILQMTYLKTSRFNINNNGC